MKTRMILFLVGTAFLSTPAPVAAQQQGPGTPPLDRVVGYEAGEQGGNYRVWNKILSTTDASGNVVLKTNQAYVELATGLNFRDPITGQWREAREEIVPCSAGAVAQQGQCQVIFGENLNSSPAIDLQGPDGRRLQSNILGLGYYDTASGNGVLIAQVKDCQGQIVGAAQVLYADAFSGTNGLKANVRYRYTKAGLEQDVILLTAPPPAEEFGLSSGSSVLQVWTEFVPSDPPSVSPGTVMTAVGSLADDEVEFGALRLGPSRAFLLGTNAPATSVSRHWIESGGRHLLVEGVPVAAIRQQLSTLPPAPGQGGSGTNLHASVGSPPLPCPRPRPSAHQPMLLARSAPPEAGFNLDYVIINTDQSAYTFAADQTYFVSAPVHFAGTTVFEAATIKLAANASLNFYDPAQVVCKGQAYRKTLFTAKDDDSVGQAIQGSSGSPQGYYANPAIQFTGGTGASSLSLTNFRIAWANTAVSASGGSLSVLLSTPLHKFAHVFQAARAIGWDGRWSRWTSLFSSSRVNFHSKGLAIAS